MKKIFTLLSILITSSLYVHATGPVPSRIGFTGTISQGETFHVILENHHELNTGWQFDAPAWAEVGLPFLGPDGAVWIPVTPSQSIPRVENTNQRWLSIVGIDNITGVRTDHGPSVKLHRQQNVGGPDGGTEGSTNGNSSGQTNPQTTQQQGTDVTKGGGAQGGCIDIRNLTGAGEIGIVTVGEILMREVEVFDQSGKKIMAVRSVDDGNRIQVDFSQQRPGLYILVVYMENQTRIVRKIQWK